MPSADRIYRIVARDDSDERACEAIPDSACTDVPRNYFLNLGNGACTKLAEQIAGPEVVLPWLFGVLGAPAGLVGFLVPIRQAGAFAASLAASSDAMRAAHD